jgi:general secretion pathway protein C
VVLAALIAYQCVTLFNVMVMPLEARPAQAAPSSELQPAVRLGSFDPFFTAPSVAVAPIAATDLTLHGLRQDRRTGGGSAIISQSAGAQRSFGVGEDIASGIVLKQVGFDHVIIVRNGMDERLAFQEFASAGAAPRAAATTASPAQRPSQPTQVASSVPEVRPGRAASRAPTLPARSIDFADPSTLPASLTSGPALRNRR